MATAVGRIPRFGHAHASTRSGLPFAHRRQESALLRARLHLADGERVLIRAGRASNATAVATDRALYWSSSPAAWTRRGWEEISRLDEVPALDLPARLNRRLVAFAQERIASTRLVRSSVAIDDHDVPVEARRRPGTGEVSWFVHLDEPLDADDPALQRKIERALAQLRSALGL